MPWLDRLIHAPRHEVEGIEADVERLQAEQRDIAARLERLELELEVLLHDAADE